MPEPSPKRPAAPPQQPASGKPRAPAPAAKVQEGEYQFLPVQCPNCGLEGKVKISRLDRTFTCKQCRKVFHVTLDGTVSGERPPEAVEADPADMVTEDPPSAVEKWISALPRAWQLVLLGAACLLLVYGISVWMEPVKPLPGELEDRALFAAKMLVTGQWKELKRLAKPGTAGDLGQWYERVRAGKWADVTPETPVKLEAGQVVKQLRGYEKQKPQLDATVSVGIQLADAAKQGEPEVIVLRFSEDEDSQWWLDGTTLMSDSKTKRPAKKKDAAPASPQR